MSKKKIPQLDSRLAIINAALVFLLLIFERFPGERWWLTTLFIYSPQEIWTIPSILLLGYFILRKKWAYAASCASMVLLIAAFLMGIPFPRGMSKDKSDFRILTWNMYYGRGGSALSELAISEWPDIICVQEANPWGAKSLQKLLKTPQFRGWDAKVCGELITLSRFPLKRIGTTNSALWVLTKVDNQEVVIANVHLAQPLPHRFKSILHPGEINTADALREGQVADILGRLPVGIPVIICGDFNTPPNSSIYREFTSRLIDSFHESGQGTGLTYQRQLPLVRIDHIFVSRQLKPVRCWLPKSKKSNHNPMCADIQL